MSKYSIAKPQNGVPFISFTQGIQATEFQLNISKFYTEVSYIFGLNALFKNHPDIILVLFD